MPKFRLALSGDFKKTDGSLAFPMFDLERLNTEPNLEWKFVDPIDGRMDSQSLKNFDALILLAAKFDQGSIPNGERFRLVARFGVGYDSVDVNACSKRGIGVAITPDGVKRPVAVSILTFMLALSSKLFVKDKLVRAGAESFAQRGDHMGVGLEGRTLGSIGIGNIGSEMFRISRPFDMKFIAYDPYVDPLIANELGVDMVDLETVFKSSDFLTINSPLTSETRHIVNQKTLSMMKRTAYLINTSRGPVIEELSLVAALKAREIAGAGLDVFDPEPPSIENPLLKLDNVILTPHSICWTDQCFAQIGASDINQVLNFKRGSIPAHLVNPEIANNLGFKSVIEKFKLSNQ